MILFKAVATAHARGRAGNRIDEPAADEDDQGAVQPALGRSSRSAVSPEGGGLTGRQPSTAKTYQTPKAPASASRIQTWM